MFQRFPFIIYLLSATFFVSGQDEVWMHPNAGQWDDRIEYKVELDLGEMLIEKDGFTYNLHNGKQKMGGHHHGEETHHETDEEYNIHVIKQKFVGSNWEGNRLESMRSGFYRNYFLGNDQSKWASELYSYSNLTFLEMYEGIDLVMDGKNEGFKYAFRIAPQTDPSIIVMSYDGQTSLFIDKSGNLHITNRFGEIVESKPIAWQETELGRREVPVQFTIKGNNVFFELPNGYNSSEELIIDPSLTFSTFSGSTVDNWGFTAAPDEFGRLYGGGIVFGSGYPLTAGAYDASFNSGQIDVGITKFSADGTFLIYSTYLGGSGSETPNSIVSAPNGELYIFGITSSANFPMAGVPYDFTFAGGPATGSTNGLDFNLGTDLYVARLNPLGTSLLSSTFVGGSSTDGLNISGLQFNYGDQFRGEIILDPAGNVYVSSNTTSPNFPVVLGTQGALSGPQDAVLFKMTPNLTTMLWSTYFGGSGEESGNSIQIALNGDVFVAGGTNSNTMPFAVGNDLTYNGAIDGFVARFNGANGNVLSGTYIGANEYDQAFFVQLDVDDNVYVLGQTETNLGIIGATYGVPNSGQFIWKYDHNLGSVLWKTMIGAGTGHVEISPTAFLVSDCYDIYLSGWGGNLNVQYSQAINSTTNGFPVTPDGHQLTTTGSNFWLAVLGQDASSLNYASFMGGMNATSPNHVDGGTSRFDKSGRIYHAVCGSCGNTNSGFTTTPGVWSPTDQSNNCNMAVFKFELSTIEAVVADPDPIVCLPNPVIFNNNSANGNAFFWDFGDGTTSTDLNPSHLYQSAGNYTVTLVVSDTNGCFTPDSIQFLVIIGDFQGGIVAPPGPICPGESYQLEAFGGVDFEWSPAQFLNDPTIANPTATVFQNTDFMVIITDSCGIDTAYVTLEVHSGSSNASNDTIICVGNDVPLFATGGGTYLWSPPTFLDNPNSATPISTPTTDITYFVEVTTVEGCILNDTVVIDVFFTPPVPVMPDVIPLCEGSSASISVSGGDTYFWYPDINITSLTSPSVTVNPSSSMYYFCDFTNACGTVTDSVFIDVVLATINAGNDTIICPGESAPIWATGGVSYFWSPLSGLSNNTASLVNASPTSPTMYTVVGMDANGCVSSDSVFVDLYLPAFIQTSPDVHAFYGDLIQLSATSTTSGPYIWTPAEFLSCVVCVDPIANPNENYTYIVTYTDINGCSASDEVNIFYDPILYVPNTFTPGDDGINPGFKAEGGNINEFEMLIFNRWGELIYTMDSLDDSWDGTYDGAICQDGTYVWKVRLTDFVDEEYHFVGHVNLLR